MIPRRVAALALAALLVGGAGIAAVVTHDDDDGGTETAAPTTTSTVLVEPTTTEAPTSTAPSTSTSVARTTTTRARPTTTTTARPGTTTTTAGRDCTASQIEVTAKTDKASYAAGEQVKVDSTLRNRSATTCLYAGHTFQVSIQDAGGRSIMVFDLVSPGPTGSPFVAGATLTGSVPWDQRSCQAQPCPQPPPGTYAAVVKWTFAGGPYETRATFSLT